MERFPPSASVSVLPRRGRRGRAILLAALAALALESGNGAAQAPADGQPGQPPEPTTGTVSIDGEVPGALGGRWLVIARLEPTPGRFIVLPSLLEIGSGADATPAVAQRPAAALPEEVSAAIERHATSDPSWQPGEDLLHRLAADWNAAPGTDGGLSERVDYRIVTPDHYDDAFRSDARAAASVAVLHATRYPRAGPGRYVPARIVDILFFQELETDTLRGDYANVQIVGAPVPAPVVLQGRYVAYRLPKDASPVSAWERLRRYVASFFSE
jgi:hypothetical protein